MNFTDLVKLQSTNHSEEFPLKLGNVDFWFDGNEFCYSPSVDKWHSRKIAEDLTALLGNRLVHVCKNCGEYDLKEDSHSTLLRDLLEQECKDADKIANLCGIPRTEGGRLQVARIVNEIEERGLKRKEAEHFANTLRAENERLRQKLVDAMDTLGSGPDVLVSRQSLRELVQRAERAEAALAAYAANAQCAEIVRKHFPTAPRLP